jgi:hypothetical protein
MIDSPRVRAIPREQRHNLRSRQSLRSCQLVEQRLGIPEVGAIEALGEPAINRHEKVGCLDTLASVSPMPG